MKVSENLAKVRKNNNCDAQKPANPGKYLPDLLPTYRTPSHWCLDVLSVLEDKFF